jgi:hypothetical protein
MYCGRGNAQKTIGFFGDSFCAHAEKDNWMGNLADHLDSKIIHTGVNGSSYWTTVIDYTKNFDQYKNLDYTIFCWTEPHRIYHPKGDLNHGTAYNKNDNRHKAAQMYIEHLQDYEKDDLEFKAVAYWLDHEYLNKIKGKIIHFYSYGNPMVEDWSKAELKDIKIIYKWQHGHNVDTPLYYISCNNDKFRRLFDQTWINSVLGLVLNHMGPEGDNWVFNTAKKALED